MTECRTHVLTMIAASPVAARTAGPMALPGKERLMEKVILPTVFGFAAMMSLWAVTVQVV